MFPMYLGIGRDPANRKHGDGDSKEAFEGKPQPKGEDMGKGLSMSQPINTEITTQSWGHASRERVTCKS